MEPINSPLPTIHITDMSDPLETNQLLILSCSQRKRSDLGFLSAIERYDGNTFRIVRRFLKNKKSPDLQQGLPSTNFDIYILSAEHGLIDSEYKIKLYDRKMTKTRAKEINYKVLDKLRYILDFKIYHNIMLCVSQNYLKALEGYELIVPENILIKVTRGGMGEKLAELYEWLYGQSAKKKNSRINRSSSETVKIRGVTISYTTEQVLKIAQSKIQKIDDNKNKYKLWYVLINKQKVAPKWLVSQLTGLPVSKFTAGEARRVLSKLGIHSFRIKK